MAVVVRAVLYATVFVGLVLVLLPARLLEGTGISTPPRFGPAQFLGIAAIAAGAIVIAWTVFAFAVLGRGTPAPFDPPRRIVVAGPYRHVRNPMYLGAGLGMAGAALFFQSAGLLGFLLAYLLAAHAFIVLYEEPSLRRRFGARYDAYCANVNRWIPRRPGTER